MLEFKVYEGKSGRKWVYLTGDDDKDMSRDERRKAFRKAQNDLDEQNN